MKKIILSLCVVLVVFSFVLSSCTTETTIIIPKSGDEDKSVACAWNVECPEGYALCMAGTCLTEGEINERFETWTMATPCPLCENCRISGKRGSHTGIDGKEYKICYDCAEDINCKEGFKCDVGRCVQSG